MPRQAIRHVEEIAKDPEARKQYARIKEVRPLRL
jgi:hypothetical protein